MAKRGPELFDLSSDSVPRYAILSVLLPLFSTWWREPLAGDLTVRWNITGFVSSDRVISYGQMQHHFDGVSPGPDLQLSSRNIGTISRYREYQEDQKAFTAWESVNCQVFLQVA